MSNTYRSIALAATLLAGSASAYATPSMYWDHLDGGTLSQADCVNKAESIMNAEKAGKFSKSEDSVRAWSEHTVGVVECIKSDGKLMIMVLAGSSDATAGDGLFKALKKG
jgi:hypothetical protein